MIDLPDEPGPASATPALLDFGALLVPPLGGAVQRVERMGSRFRISVTMPPMRGNTARIWLARLIRGKSEGVRLALPLQGFQPGTPGAPVVNGAGQAGRSLAIRGAQPGYRFREGQFFSVSTGGRHHLQMIDAETPVGADGTALLPVSPMLRVPHADGDPLHVGKPMIEGMVMGDELAWEMSLAHYIGLQFEVMEVV